MLNDIFLLLGLFTTALLAATILPLGSELAFVGMITQQPHLAVASLVVATLGNGLGSIMTYFMTTWLPEKHTQRLSPKALAYAQQYGAAILFFAWLPVVGDLLPVACGWLRLNVWRCVAWIMIGKLARYAFLYCSVVYFQNA